MNAVLLEENPKSDIVVFHLQSCEFTENRRTGLVGELVGALYLLLLGLKLLLEALDFRLDDLDSILPRLDVLLQFGVAEGLENNPKGQSQRQERDKSERNAFNHGKILTRKRASVERCRVGLERDIQIRADDIVGEFVVSEIHIVENGPAPLFAEFCSHTHAPEEAIAVGGRGRVAERRP